MSLFIILLLSLYLSNVDALSCYTCSPTNNRAACKHNIQTCQLPQETCMTSKQYIQGRDRQTVKRCENDATCIKMAIQSGLNDVGDGYLVTCCSTDLCNSYTIIEFQKVLLLLPLSVLYFISKY
ncbi:hypothetical protein UPYG_G00154980 [Umbra pygmaea]|uniref:Snake toxin/toxin-like domain-containing protein n=1 Tax=Umbra pygmaea TaxID=75934 RepID=A0ABD0XKK2_UMBPY